MTLSIAVVCEAPADRNTATGLADRVLCAEVDWIDESVLDGYRLWRGREENETHLLWRDVHRLARERRLRAHGHFDGQPGAPDAAAARLALLLLHGSPRPPDAVLLIRDDDRQTERRRGLEQAREHATTHHFATGPIVIGLAHPCRECWVLAGFEPDNQEEEDSLRKAREELSFHPRDEAVRLTARHDHELRSPKRVLALLVADNWERQSDCWRCPPLASLEQRGAPTGLADYLRELRERLVPLFTPPLPPPARPAAG